MLKDKFTLGIVLLTIVTLIGAVFFISATGNFSSSNSTGSTLVSDEQKKLLEVVSDDYIKGNKEATVTLVEYLDFECEACQVYYPITKQLKEEYKDKIRFIVRYFPLPGHKNSMTSALAVEAAGKQNKFWEMIK